MQIVIGADHRGYDLKNKLKEYLTQKGYEVIDVGAKEYDALDDNPVFGEAVSKAVLEDKSRLGIVICGSGIGISIAANRTKGIYCGLAFDEKQLLSGKQHDHLNVISLPADYISFEKATALVDIFLSTKNLEEEKYIRRRDMLDTI